MDEYISREAIVKKIEEKLKVDDLMSLAEEVWTNECLKIALRAIREVETADVQPVTHGRWIDCSYYDPCVRGEEQDIQFKCSNCGHRIYNKPNDNNLFCGHCSARMSGDTNG